MGEFDEHLKEFLIESLENLEELDRDLLSLENNPDDRELLSSIFRCIHTIKGTGGFFGFPHLGALTHAGESLLAKLRDGTLTVSREITDALLGLGDAVREILGRIEQSGEEGDEAYAELVETLTQLYTSPAAPVHETSSDEPEPEQSSEEPEPEQSSEALEPEQLEPEQEESDGESGADSSEEEAVVESSFDTALYPFDTRVDPPEDRSQTADEARSASPPPASAETAAPVSNPDPPADPANTPDEVTPEEAAELVRTAGERGADPELLGQMLVDSGHITAEALADALARQAQGDPRHVGELLVEQGEAEPEDVVEALKTQNEVAGTSSLAESTIRVDVTLLDKLMTMVGELVLARNQTMQFGASIEDRGFVEASQRLNLITTELQEAVMKTRMQPIHTIWSKFPRVVRDLSHSIGKQIRIEMEGEDTELDRTILDAIKDPLTHIIRNSVDHGIETPEVRRAAGKPAEGVMRLRAYHEGGNVIIEIQDDGAGLDLARVKAKALQMNLLTPDQAAGMGDRELANVVFAPGFSTAKKVTSVSGRGVGMDVVKTNIERIGGSVDLTTKEGEGTTIKTKIPLTLAIIPALIVTCGGTRYAIPQVSLLELVRLDGRAATSKIEMIHGAAVYRLRGDLLPLVYLKELLRLSDRAVVTEDDPEAEDAVVHHEEDEAINIIVLQADDQQFGLIVESVQDTEEIVVKPLSRQLKDIPVYAGAAIMGDGRVAVILDVLGIAQSGNVLSELQERALLGADVEQEEGEDHRQALLLFQASTGAPMAMPLSMVARLEKFDLARVEELGELQVVQYRDEILPLLRVSEFFGNGHAADDLPEDSAETAHTDEDTLKVVVCACAGQNVGLIVDTILDVSEEVLDVQGHSSRDGVMYTAVVQGRITEFVDVDAILRAGLPSAFEEILAAAGKEGAHG